MAMKPFLAFAAALLVLGGSFAVATHMGVPPVSEGGEFAYVREYDAGDLAKVESNERITATYVAFTPDRHNEQQERVDRFDSRGRVSDTTLFHKIDLPEGTFDEVRFSSVDHIERGVLVGEGPSACAYFLNGVNAGVGLSATDNASVRILVTGEFDISQEDDSLVKIERDGHTYLLETTGAATIDVDGGNIRVDMADGDQLRGWIDREFPATTKVMHSEFDHLDSECQAAADPEPEPEPQPEPEPEPEPTASDAGVSKEVLEQDEEAVKFGIVVESFGDENATDVNMTDELPESGSDWFLGGADSEDCVLDDRNLSCDFGELAPGEGRSVTVTGYVRGMCGEMPNTARVSSTDDGNASNDESTAVADLGPCEDQDAEPSDEADVEAVKEVLEQDDETVTFQLQVVNHGPAEAYGDGVYLNDTLPQVDGDWFVGGPDADACSFSTYNHTHDDGSQEEHGSSDGDTLVCNWETVPANESRTVTVTGYIRGMCGELENTATVWAENDVSPENNEDTAVADLGPCAIADAAVNKTSAQTETDVIYTITVDSIGDESVHNVTLFDELPDIDSRWYVGGADGSDCTLEGRNLTCAFGDLAPGDGREIKVKAYTDKVACGSDVENTASITSDDDGDASNDEDSDVFTKSC